MKKKAFPPCPPVSNMYLACRRAIRRGRKISFIYKGTKQKGAFPQILGHRDGKEWLFVYQTDGESDYPLPNWRCIKVWLMSDLREIAGKWDTGSSHKQRQSCIDIVDIDYNRNADQRYNWPKPKAKKGKTTPSRKSPVRSTAKKKKVRTRKGAAPSRSAWPRR